MSAQTAPNTRVYAIGDVHGMGDKLNALLEIIQKDAEDFSGQKVLVTLGDYIDRGLQSKEVLERLSTLNWSGWEHVFLKGNHEHGCLAFLKDPESLPKWCTAWGGETMLQSYGVPVAHTSTPTVLRDKLLACLLDSHLTFMQNLSLSYVSGDYLFVHGGLRPNIPLEEQTDWDLMFIGEEAFHPDVPHGLPYRVVYGHRPKEVPLVQEDRICIDTAAYRGCPLTAVVLEGKEVRFLQA